LSEIERLDTLAARINAEHRACETAVNAALEHALAAGDLLLEAKSKCPHGTWQGWLEENFDGSVRTAQAYMRVAARRDEVEAAKTQSSAPLSLDGALRALSAPKEEAQPSLAELEAKAEAARTRALDGTYEAAEALIEIAGINPDRLAGAIAMLARTHDEKHLRDVLGYAWEKAFQEYKVAVLTSEEEWRLRTLRAFDEHVRPVDLPPGRGRFAFEDELTYREMHTTFAHLIAGGQVADHTSVAHHIRVMRDLHVGGHTEMFEHYLHALQRGTVRPVADDAE
jgi:hypothetical protein